MTFNRKHDWRELGSSKLTKRALKYLAERGITPEIARKCNLRSLTADETAAIWGRACKHESLLVPFDEDYGTARIFDLPVGRKDKFRSTPNAPTRLYLPPLVDWDKLKNEPKELLNAEGPFKAICASAHGFPCIGFAGCWNWQKDRQPLPELEEFKWRKRKVTPVFDADIDDNDNVALPFFLLGDWYESQGAVVQSIGLPKVAGSKTGIDDFIAKRGKDKFKDLPRLEWHDPKLEALRTTVMRRTEGGLAALFLLRHSADLRFDDVESTWFAWDGSRWVRQGKNPLLVQERMKETVVSIINDATRIKNADRRKLTLHWGLHCDRKQAVHGAIELASSDPRIQLRTDAFDRDPWLLGVDNGVLELRTGALVSASRDHLISKSAAVSFDPNAECPQWKAFVLQIMNGDEEMAAFMRRLAGYCLIGGNPLRLIFFLYGTGRNGKTVWIEVLSHLLGEYAVATKTEIFMRGDFSRDPEGATPFTLRLRGARYITASEVRDGMELDAATIKNFTGGDKLTARGLHRAPIEFVIEGKPVVRTNHKPIVASDDLAIWDRIVMVPFDRRFTDEEQDTELSSKLRAELPGILNWVLAGCLDYQRVGLKLPNRVRAQTDAYRLEMDSFGQWLTACTKKHKSFRCPSKVLYESYAEFCQSHEDYPLSQRAFNEKLEAENFRKKESNGKTFWYGVRLLDDPVVEVVEVVKPAKFSKEKNTKEKTPTQPTTATSTTAGKSGRRVLN